MAYTRAGHIGHEKTEDRMVNADLCPWLGVKVDPDIRHLEASESHVCHAREWQPGVDLDYQERYCLRSMHRSCEFYRQPPDEAPPVYAPPDEVEDDFGPPPFQFPILRLLPWAVAGLAVAAVVVYYGWALLGPQPAARATATTMAALAAAGSPTATPSPSPTLTPSPLPPSPTGPPTFEFVEPTGTPTPYPGGAIYSLSPGTGAAGWVASNETRGNHLGDSYLYTGLFDGVAYHGALQFDLSALPRGAAIHAATLELAGLDAGRLGGSGVWEVRLLAREADDDWGRVTFQDLRSAPVQWTLSPALEAGDLDEGRINAFALPPEQTQDLAQRLLDGHPTVSFLLVGPAEGENSLFAWDTGYGPATEGRRPRLLLSVGAPPMTPLATLTPTPTETPEWFVVTSTPRPENALTAAAVAMQATAWATTTGTPTPLPRFLATATPRYIVVTLTPAPENSATAAYLQALATANAVLTGTPTPTPENLATVDWFVVTSSPTPENVLTAAAVAARETRRATTTGTPTPLPEYVATATPNYIVVTHTPTPENLATAAWWRSLATANVILTGTPTPRPPNLATATYTPRPTRTPVLVWLDRVTAVPTYTSTPTPTPLPPIPAPLRGKIAFLSDRTVDGEPAVYLLDPGTGRLALLTDRWPYDKAVAQQRLSPDGQYEASVRSGERGVQIYVTQLSTGVSWAITYASTLSYDPAWSPRGDLIAYVSQEMGPQGGGDEVFAVNPQGAEESKRRLTFNTWEWDKHPTFSPDGSQIVFWSNQMTGLRQLWIMNVDGSERRILLHSPYNDWDPVWIR